MDRQLTSVLPALLADPVSFDGCEQRQAVAVRSAHRPPIELRPDTDISVTFDELDGAASLRDLVGRAEATAGRPAPRSRHGGETEADPDAVQVPHDWACGRGRVGGRCGHSVRAGDCRHVLQPRNNHGPRCVRQFAIHVPADGYGPLAWAPDERAVAVEVYSDRVMIFVADLRGKLRLLSQIRSRDDEEAAWSPDGREIAFITCRRRYPFNCHLALIGRNGTGRRVVVGKIGDANTYDVEPVWAPNGRAMRLRSGSEKRGRPGMDRGAMRSRDTRSTSSSPTGPRSGASRRPPSWIRTQPTRLHSHGRRAVVKSPLSTQGASRSPSSATAANIVLRHCPET
jgi:hypothetical protein